MKKTNLDDITRDLGPNGTSRVVVLVGEDHNSCSNTIKYLGHSIVGLNPRSFFAYIDAEKTVSPTDWCSQFARNLKTGTSLLEDDMFSFALSVGETIGSSAPTLDGTKSSSGNGKNGLADSLVEHFDQLISMRTEDKGLPDILVAISGLHELSDSVRKWLIDDLNHALRKSSNFKKCRFLFSTNKQTEAIESFFNQFGFEKVHYKQIDEDPKNSLPKSDSSKLLESDMISSSVADSLKNFSESDLGFLKLCSYPHRISKYTLEHFTSSRDAALAFNWLSRQKKLHIRHESGDLLLEESLKTALRLLHAEQDPSEAEQWSIYASVLDAFHALFPVDSSHWIPLNLQLLQSFDKQMIQNLFNEDQVSELLNLLELTPEVFTEIDSRYSLNDEAKTVTRRYMEISGRSASPELENAIRDLWLKDADKYNSRKLILDEEKDNISTEIEDTLKQVAGIKEARDQLIENFRNPKKNKAEKVYTFTTSRLLIVVGFTTVGASLLSESIGSYHAACGLALSLFGFFWPNVETKRPAFAGNGSSPNLAIETQQRSLNHRLGSLSNRVQVMQGNLNTVKKQLAKLGDSPPLPYLDSKAIES
jgi:hypothetical protein